MNAHRLVEAETDRFQGILNKAYGRWQKGGEHENKDMSAFVGSLEEPERMATVLGKFNQQVTNGGIHQWIENGYAEAQWPHLPEYAKQFAHTANGRKFFRTIKMISDMLEDSGADSFEELTDDKSEKVRDAIMTKEWDTVYELLGGTDLDDRKFRLAMDDEVKNGLSVETRPARDGGGKFKFVLKFEEPSGGEIDVYDSEEKDDKTFDSEELADDAGSQHELRYRDIDDDDVVSQIEDKVLNEIVDEYADLGNSQFNFDRIDRDYYTYNDAWMAELEQYFKTEYPDTMIAKLQKALKGGVDAVRQGVKNAGEKVRGFGQRVGRAATAAQKAFRGESARKVVDSLLGESTVRVRNFPVWFTEPNLRKALSDYDPSLKIRSIYTDEDGSYTVDIPGFTVADIRKAVQDFDPDLKTTRVDARE